MSSTTRNLMLAILLILTCSGCTIPLFTNPLVSPDDAKVAPKLHGVYRTTDCPENILQYEFIGPASECFPGGFIRIVSVSQPKDSKTALKSSTSLGFVEPIGQHYILHLPLPKTLQLDDSQIIWKEKWDAREVGGYIIVRLSARPDGMEMSALNDSFIQEQIAAKKLAGKVVQKEVKRDDRVVMMGEKTITVTADSKELREFFERHIDGQLFEEPDWRFTRVE